MENPKIINALFKLLKAHYLLLIGFLLIIIFSRNNAYKYFEWKQPNYRHAITSDGTGYYAYLPQHFIYRTSNFEFDSVIHKDYPTHNFFSMLGKHKGKTVDKYPIGTAIFNAPFFLSAHLYATLSSKYPADGYSLPYEKMIFYGGLFYLLVGLFFIYCTFQLYSIPKWISVLVLSFLFFGTNLSYYVVSEPSLSHIISFFLIAVFLFISKKYTSERNNYQLLLIFTLLGFITITRATNFLVVLIVPFLFSDWKTFVAAFKELIFAKRKLFIVGMLLFIACVMIQYANTYHQIGIWSINNYTDEKFDYLFNPQIVNVLFSYRKGFFIYTPFFVLFPISLAVIFKRHSYLVIGICFFFACFVYIMASWWCWYYGGSYGMRPMIDVYPILVLPIMLMMQQLSNWIKILVFLFLSACIYYTSVQSYQMQTGILHYEHMNKERFWQVFLKKDDRFKWIFYQEDLSFNTDSFNHYGKFQYRLGAKNWTQTKTANTDQQEIESMIPLLTIPKDSSWKNSIVGLKVQLTTKVMKHSSIPKTAIIGYKNGETHYLATYFYGQHLPNINQFYPITFSFHYPTSIEDMDSLSFRTEIENTFSSVKALNYDVYFQEKK